ncbi:MAG: metallophosphoesterase [Clostridia bacterium]|nr:metallophosphoesterase [Clostridia bacterium]
MNFAITSYVIPMKGITKPLRLAIIADFHNGDAHAVYEATLGEEPDIVLLPGDFLHKVGEVEQGFALLTQLAARYPTYASIGNHEVRCNLPDLAARVGQTGAVLLDNALASCGELTLGGLSSGFAPGMKQRRTHPTPPPDRHFLAEFAKLEGGKVLLCHHPEYYTRYIHEKDIPLTVSGHAHGGQWEFFGRGVFAPGQGLFPRYTAGMYDSRLLVSRGLAIGSPGIPRINNPRELAIVDLWPQ